MKKVQFRRSVDPFLKECPVSKKIFMTVAAVLASTLSSVSQAQTYSPYAPTVMNPQVQMQYNGGIYPSQPPTVRYPNEMYDNGTNLQDRTYQNGGYSNGTYQHGVYPNSGIEAIAGQATLVRIPWSQKLIESADTTHDFGAVAAYSKQEHVFKFVNTTDATLNLVYVKASCGCTKPTILTPTVAPGETAKVLAQFQTRTFRGEKRATVTVQLARVDQQTQRGGEVQFSVKGKIRKDVVLDPGSVEFASVSASQVAQQTVKMKYAGSPLWRILNVKSTNPHLAVEAREVSRADNGRVAYDLVVKVMDSMPTGAFQEKLTIFTNDKNTPQMPIAVSGRIKPALEASSIQLGIVKQGTKVEKRFVIRGEKPFRIKEILLDSDKVSFTPASGEKSLHVIPFTVDTSLAQAIRETLTIVTDAPETPMKKVDFNIRIVPNVVAGN